MNPPSTNPPAESSPNIGAGAARSSSTTRSLSTVARSGALNLTGHVAGGLSGLALVLVVTNGFAQATAGLLFATTAVFAITAAVAELGTDTGLSHTVQRELVAGRPDGARATLRIALVPVLTVSLVLAAVGWFVAPSVAGIVAGDGAGAIESATWMLRVLALALPVATTYSSVLACTRAYRTMSPNVTVEKLGRLPAQIIGVGLVAALGADPVWAAFAWALPYLPALIVVSRWYRRVSRSPELAAGPDVEPEDATSGEPGDGAGVTPAGPSGAGAPAEPADGLAARFWAFTAPRALGRICQVALHRADIVLVAAILGPRSAAIYTAVTKFLAVGQLATHAVTQVLQPQLSRLFAAGDLVGARAVFGTAAAWLMALAWPIYLTGAVAAPLILQVFGPGYVAGHAALVILTLTMLVAVACGPVDTALLMAGRSRQSLGNSAAALAVDLLLIFLLVPPFGVTGAALAWSAALLVRNLLPVWQVYGLYRLWAFGPATAWVAGSAVVCFGVVPGLAMLVFGGGGSGSAAVVTMLVVLPITGLAYAVLLWRERRLLELAVFAPMVRRVTSGLARSIRRRGTKLAGRLARRIDRLARRLPIPTKVRVALSRLFLRRLRPVHVRLDRVLLGSQDGMSIQRYANAFDDLMWASTPITEGPHVELLKLAESLGPRRLSAARILDSAYGEHARRCLALSGRYFWATDDAGIVEVARSFIARAGIPAGGDAAGGGIGRGGSEAPRPGQSRPTDPILVAPIKDSYVYSLIDGHHRAALAAYRGKRTIEVTVKRIGVTTPLQELLTRMSWIGGKPELYQPVSAPELGGHWSTVRRCTDRLEKIEVFLASRRLARTEYRMPSYLDVACCYGWFVAQLGERGFAASGLERDPLGRRLGAAIYGLDPEQIQVGDAGEFLRTAVEEGHRWDVVSCFSLLHHFVLGRGDGTSAEDLVRLLSSVTRSVLFLDTGQDHEAWFTRSLAGWNTERIAAFLAEHGDFTEVVDLGADSDAVGPYAANYGRHLFACVKGVPRELADQTAYGFLGLGG